MRAHAHAVELCLGSLPSPSPPTTLPRLLPPLVSFLASIERDPALSYAKVPKQTVSGTALVLIVIFVPGGCFALCHALWALRHRREARVASKGGSSVFKPQLVSFLYTVLALVQTIALNAAITNTVKIYVGRPRPNFFALCNYAGYADALASGNFAAYNVATTAGAFGDLSKCQASAADVEEAQLSFPSGHASYSFAALVFCALYLRLVLGVPRASVFSPAAMLAYGPLILAGWVACSRIRDHYHNPDDVAVGAGIGIVAAVLGWRHYLAHRRHTCQPRGGIPLEAEEGAAGGPLLPTVAGAGVAALGTVVVEPPAGRTSGEPLLLAGRSAAAAAAAAAGGVNPAIHADALLATSPTAAAGGGGSGL